MTNPRPQHPFNVRHSDVWKIALPASIAFITEPMVGLVDITIIGRLGDAGLLGGLVLGALLFDVLFSLAYFLRIGTAGLTAQAFLDPGRPGVLRLYPGRQVIPGEFVDVYVPDLVSATKLHQAF